MKDELYFAYGSNINLRQMEQRCPNAELAGPVTLENYELQFRGNSRMCGVATIVPKEGSSVPGVLWRLTPACEKSLDIYEGYPSLYDKQWVTVKNKAGRDIQVMAYVMTNEKTRPFSPPSLYYYNGIREGYKSFGFNDRILYDAAKQAEREARKVYKKRQQER